MDVHLPAVTNREYAKCDAPGIIIPPFEGTKPAPVLAVRQIGEAWDKPFAVVFEPHKGTATSGTVTNVTTLLRSNIVVGLKVQSVVSGQSRTQYILSNPNGNETYSDPALGLFFTGRFAVVTDKGNNTGSLYLGSGSTLSYRGWSVASVGGTNTQANVDFALGSAPVVTANSPVNVSVPAAPNFTQIARQTSGVISLTATGSVGVPYRLLARTNLGLGSWMQISAGSVTNSPFVIQDAGATNQAARFYRFSTP
jgi:hypothetical protein